ncbi:MAG TPA: SIS domain-containing protein [Baekduia sp.]|uniref:SIS domain-containing protein n=1 Tax=Baekduia sp. TaxID=2600305 RepID=UPI002D79653A|nr:SIS domain-containing protein [Baekduia sp.]HET6507772.1 SIS domain-containing protein [Baekduia sp.]
MNPDGFLADVLDEPRTLAHLADHADPAPLRDAIAQARLVVLTGMGSSRFAALTAAARLRAQGVAAVVEYASTDLPTKPAPDVLAIGISATGTSAETVAALERHHGTSRTIAITNADDGGRLGALADRTVALHAGPETGGVACKTFRATLALLLLAAGADRASLARAADAQQVLLDARGDWVDPLLDALDPGRTTYAIAPASRISSSLQSALMLREGPRVPADATETGDWSHVDVYLTKHPNYTALLYPGSPYDAEALDWLRERRSTYISIGRAIPGAALHIPFPHADDDLVAALVDVTVAELAAATWWRRRLDSDAMP